MPLYTATFFNSDETVGYQQQIDAADDDAVIDAVGESLHPHAIDVHEGERHVGRFAAMRPQQPFR